MFQVGPPEMFDNHQRLIELRKQEKELEVSQFTLERMAVTHSRCPSLTDTVKREFAVAVI